MVKMVNFIVHLTTIKNYGRIKKKLKGLKQPFNYARRCRGEASELGARRSGRVHLCSQGLGLRRENSKAERRG